MGVIFFYNLNPFLCLSFKMEYIYSFGLPVTQN